MNTKKMTSTPRIRFLKIAALATALLPTGGLAEQELLEVPTAATGYRESVRCMPEIRSAGSLSHIPGTPAEMSLEAQETNVQVIPLSTSIDGDIDPDVLLFGADTYRESVACTARHFGTLISYGVAVQWMPDASLEAQEELPVAPLPGTASLSD